MVLEISALEPPPRLIPAQLTSEDKRPTADRRESLAADMDERIRNTCESR